MEPLATEMDRAWTSLSSGSAGDREWRALRINAEHPLDVFAAVRESDMTRGLLFECPEEVAPAWRFRFDSEGLRLLDTKDPSGGIRGIVLVLERTDLGPIFTIIAQDLISSSIGKLDAAGALTVIGSRLSAWQACLKVRREGFGKHQIIGLFGELVILEKISNSIGFDRGISYWSGPERGIHDFEMGAFSIEVKTSLGLRGSVSIGSLEQLDTAGISKLILCRVAVVADPNGIDLRAFVSRLRGIADSMGAGIRGEFDRRILLTGFIDIESQEVSSNRFSVAAVEGYEVREGFPRLTKETVTPGVTSAEYQVDLANATKFLITAGAFDELLTELSIGG